MEFKQNIIYEPEHKINFESKPTPDLIDILNILESAKDNLGRKHYGKENQTEHFSQLKTFISYQKEIIDILEVRINKNFVASKDTDFETMEMLGRYLFEDIKRQINEEYATLFSEMNETDKIIALYDLILKHEKLDVPILGELNEESKKIQRSGTAIKREITQLKKDPRTFNRIKTAVLGLSFLLLGAFSVNTYANSADDAFAELNARVNAQKQEQQIEQKNTNIQFSQLGKKTTSTNTNKKEELQEKQDVRIKTTLKKMIDDIKKEVKNKDGNTPYDEKTKALATLNTNGNLLTAKNKYLLRIIRKINEYSDFLIKEFADSNLTGKEVNIEMEKIKFAFDVFK
jgi:hypothetical protein